MCTVPLPPGGYPITVKYIIYLLLTIYYSGDQINNEMGSASSMYEDRSGAYRVLVGKHERKRPFGRLRHTWEDNIKMNP
jgi:hypothetical protein